MSGFLGLGLEDATGLFAGRYQPASFRGAPFVVVEEAGEGGRSLGIHLMPLRETHEIEDLGRALSRITVTGYVIGDDYLGARDALLKACEGDDEPGTLVLPTLGERDVRCESVRYLHNMKEGGFVAFEMVFVEAAAAAPPGAVVDGLRQTLRQVGQVLSTARRVYALYRAANGNLGAFLARAAGSFAAGLAESLSAEWLGLPGLDLAGTRRSIDTLRDTDGEDATATASAVAEPFQAVASASGTLADATQPDGAGAAQVVARSRPEDASPGLRLTLLLARAVAPTMPDDADTQAVADLARDAAAAAAAQAAILAAWQSSRQALAARDALLAVLDLREVAAADRDESALAADFRALAAEAHGYLTATAARLPLIAPYALPQGLPALALAQRLHADAARADGLVALNAARHPGFMPAAGERLLP